MKLFSVEEANALLPTVRRIVAQIARAHAFVASRRESSQRAAEGASASGGGFMPEGAAYVRALTALVESTGELETLGVQIKDYARGLIDFPAMREGRVVLLCWELGEGDQIEWWHDTEAGYAGRQPL
ncbi:MAG: hypothetical protein QOF61_514 [Acidobacteriota bacterium]|jgi:hypothetical protein|nr:hypothetical protein [Acidobacteriota bacterium]